MRVTHAQPSRRVLLPQRYTLTPRELRMLDPANAPPETAPMVEVSGRGGAGLGLRASRARSVLALRAGNRLHA